MFGSATPGWLSWDEDFRHSTTLAVLCVMEQRVPDGL